MFFRIKIRKDGLAEDGRPTAEHWQEHIDWCIDTFENNKPDTPEVMEHIQKTCVSFISRPQKYKEKFAGDAAYNAFVEISRRPKGLWEEVATVKQKRWLKNFDTKFSESNF